MRAFEAYLLTYLLNSLWQAPLLFAFGLVAVRWLRAAGPVAEHRAWVCVGLLESLLPAASLLPWEWLHWYSPNGTGQVTVAMGAGIAGSSHLRFHFAPVIAIAYSASFAWFVARFLWSGWRLVEIRRDAVPLMLTGEAGRAQALCSERFGVRDVAIARSPRVFGPITMGTRRRAVILPANLPADSPDLLAVLAHEFAHMHRNDFAKNLVYELLLLPVSYHPLTRLVRDRMNESREMVCDALAAELNGRRPFARSLLRLASLLMEPTPSLATHAIGLLDANALERRVMKLSEKPVKVTRVRLALLASCCVLAAAATCGSALALRMHVDRAAAFVGAAAPETAAPRKITVSSGVMAGNIISRIAPKYPDAAKKAHIQGTVVLAAVIGKDGTIEHLDAVSGPAELQPSALDAVRQWTYKPYLLNGEPVEVNTTVNVTYSLAK